MTATETSDRPRPDRPEKIPLPSGAKALAKEELLKYSRPNEAKTLSEEKILLLKASAGAFMHRYQACPDNNRILDGWLLWNLRLDEIQKVKRVAEGSVPHPQPKNVGQVIGNIAAENEDLYAALYEERLKE